MKKVCVVTGTRAEYGLLKPLIEKIYRSDAMELQLVATGMHLSSEFGWTYREIEKDGYPITSKIEMLLDSDTPTGITKSMGIAMLGFADYFATNKSDILVVLGDRYEMLAVAIAAMMAGIPIAHIHGGERTEGAVDEAIRHSITKMSQLHFTATEDYRRRVIQLGEQPEAVYNVGALGVENAKKTALLSKEELERQINFSFSLPMIIVTYHPVTLETNKAEEHFYEILSAIEKHKEISVIFTRANADTGGRVINKMIDAFVEKNKNRCAVYASLGQVRYLSALQFCSAVVGNSSSGLIEAPSFKIPTVNIGDRQRGRVCAGSVISCSWGEVESALSKALSKEFRDKIAKVHNPYEKEGTSDRIIEIISKALENKIELKKGFYDLGMISLGSGKQ